MKAKIFEVVLHKLPSGKSPATALEEQLNEFLVQRPNLQLVEQQSLPILTTPATNILQTTATSGGSIEAGRASLNMRVPLFAPVYEGMPESAVGNRELLGHGARPLLKSRSTGKANMKDVFAAVFENERSDEHAQYSVTDEASSQLTLFEQSDKGYGKRQGHQ